MAPKRTRNGNGKNTNNNNNDEGRHDSAKYGSIKKFAPYDPNKKQPTFKDVLKQICHLISQEYADGPDIAKSLKQLQLVDLDAEAPTLETSQASDPEQARRDNRVLESRFDFEVQEHVSRIRSLRINLQNLLR